MRRDLQGHRKASFTGATEDGKGLVEAADLGTLFLDEVAELVVAEQPRLLRVVESRWVRRIGQTTERRVDVWFVSATNVDPREAMAAGRLRRDLFYRLAAVTVTLAPLRERPEDIGPLVGHWCATKEPAARVEQGAVDVLSLRPWPGNVRQLFAVLDRAWIDRDGAVVRACDLDLDDLGDARTDPTAELMARAVQATGTQRSAAGVLGWSWGRWCHHKRRLGLTFDD